MTTGLRDELEEPLLQGKHTTVEEAPPGLIAYEHEQENLYAKGAHWLQTTSALLALQLGWGLWLFPADFARLGWYTGTGCLAALALFTVYSGFLFARLYEATPGAVLFGDIGHFAAGRVGRNIVFAIIYSLDATRCVILHLAASQSLLHVFPEDSRPPLWQCGVVVLLIAAVLVQIRSLAELTWVFTAGTLSQLVAIVIVLHELITDPNPEAHQTKQAVTQDNMMEATVALMNMIFAFGGQFAFTELMSSMQRPKEFPKSIFICTIIMTILYGAVGAVGYWSRGDAITGIIIFDLGHSPRIRFAAACILVQATSQYLVNLNVWVHNLLVLLGRSSSNPNEPQVDAQCSSEHCPRRWLGASIFVCTYSFLISTTVPYFGTLVGLVTSATYLLCAYALPAWFTLKMMRQRLPKVEVVILYALIPVSVLLSGVGLYGSVLTLAEDIKGGEGGGWS